MNETIQIHLFEATQDIFEKIFKEIGEIINKKYVYIYTRYLEELLSKNTIQRFINRKKFIQKGYKYPKLSDENIQSIFEDLMETIKKTINKNKIIITFGNKYLKTFLKMINNIEIDHPFVLFNYYENNNFEENYFDKFKFKNYISYIKDKYDPNLPYLNLHKIISYLWEKDCYYNERGNLSCAFTPVNLLYKQSNGFIFFNILLIGESRAGKSTFINRMSNKLVSYESSKFESITREITYYEYNS